MNVRLLICEDDKPMVEVMTRYIQPIASKIDSTGDLEEALQMARDNYYNLVFLDLKLERTGKDEAFKAIGKFREMGAVVVVVSGLPDPQLKLDALKAGAAAFVPKDDQMTAHAMIVASYAATLHIPPKGQKSGSYWDHVELLKKLAETA